MRAFVRPYESRDRAAVLEIPTDTGFLGAPAWEPWLTGAEVENLVHGKLPVTQRGAAGQ